MRKVASDYFYFSEFSLRKTSWGKGVRDLSKKENVSNKSSMSLVLKIGCALESPKDFQKY